MYPKAKYINIFESKFVHPNKTGRAGATYASNSDLNASSSSCGNNLKTLRANSKKAF